MEPGLRKSAGPESARRALLLLFAFEDQPVASVSELAQAVELPAPTVHRYIAMFRGLGLIEEASRGQYRLTMRVTALAKSARSANSLISIVDPILRDLSERLKETALLVQPIDGTLLCTHKVETNRRLRLSFEVGQQLPALRGASSRLHIGFMPSSQQKQYVTNAIARGEHRPLLAVNDFLLEAHRDAEQGWAVSRHEIDEGVWAATAPILRDGKLVAILSTPCLSYEVSSERADIILSNVIKAANQMSDDIGF